jgi:hypothetical protein
MAASIIDERTLAGWLSGPTEARASDIASKGEEPLILYADVEEHVKDASSGATKRCDLTLRGKHGPVATAEMKRPEIAQVNDPALQLDAWKKAIARGLQYFLTCNFSEVAVWETAKGSNQLTAKLTYHLAPGMKRSSNALSRRNEISENWKDFLDVFVPILRESLFRTVKKGQLPPQAIDLRDAIQHTADEAASRIRAAASDDNFREMTLSAFRSQFGVEISLDPLGNTDKFVEESDQVAMISAFVVTTRLMLYQALASNSDSGFNLDELDVMRTTSDARRVATDLVALYDHARRRTQDFEVQFTATELDDIVFVDAPSITADVGRRWGRLIDVIRAADWQGPAAYIPGLYEALLDDEHRHVMGVHYTPDPVAEAIAAYVVENSTDVVIDPASGAGTFVTMCYERKRRLGASHKQSLEEVYAMEIADFAASLSGLNLTLADSTVKSAYPRVIRADFFASYPGERSSLKLPAVGVINYPAGVDGVVGNPPYIRFENRTPSERLEIVEFLHRNYARTQLPYPNFTGKADVWAFFVAGAHMYLRAGGRLGFVLSWNLLASEYGDAVLAFLGRYFAVDAIIDSRVERWFAAKQNTLILLARKLDDPTPRLSSSPNPSLSVDHLVRFVRLKQPLETLLDSEQDRGKKAEDLVDELLSIRQDVGEDLRWDVRVFPQVQLVGVAGMELPADEGGDRGDE